MKILHCLAQIPQMTGSGIYYRHVVEGMAEQDHQNIVLYGIQRPYEGELQGVEREYPVSFKTALLPFPVPGMSDEMPYDSTIYSQMTAEQFEQWSQAFREKLFQIKKNEKLDVIITHHIFILSSIVKEVFPDLPIVGICHSTDIRQIHKNPWLKEKYIHHADKLDAYFCLGPTDAEQLENIFNISKEKIHIIGGGFNDQIFYPPPHLKEEKNNNKHIRLIFSGKIAQAKGIYELAKAFPKILNQFPQAELLVVGNATKEQRESLRRLAKYTEKLKFTTSKPQKEYANLLRTSDIYILPSYYEGMGLSAIEALATKTRVVITEIKNLQWLLGSTVNESGVITYVKLPSLEKIDTPVEAEIPMFVDRLANAVVNQIAALKKENDWTEEVLDEIHSHAWPGIIEKIEQVLLYLNKK